MSHKLRAATVLGTALLMLPTAAVAKSDKSHKPHKVKTATYVFKGVWHADGTVTVTKGNARVRKGGFVGDAVAFDLAAAKLRVADTNADGAVTVEDLVEGDKVVVQARLPRVEPGTGPFAARKLVDQTHPKVQQSDDAPKVEGSDDAPTVEPSEG